MWSKLQWRYFFILLIPSIVILLLGMGLTFYSHRHAMETMRRDMETARQQTIEIVSSGVDTLFKQASMTAVNLSFQIDAMQNNNASQIAQFNNAIDQMLFMQANSISLFHSLINRCYIFLLNENRVITNNTTGTKADDFFQAYLRINDLQYRDFKAKYQSEFCSAQVLADVPVGYMQSTHHEWLLLQTFPIDPSLSPKGLIVFSLNQSALTNLLKDGLLDDDSICILTDENTILKRQGRNQYWTDGLTAELMEKISPDSTGTEYMVLSDGKTYMVASAPCSIGRVLSVQPQSTVFLSLNHYNNSILLWMVGIVLLDTLIAMVFTNRNVAAMNRVIGSIPMEHQADSATNVFNYVEQAFMNAREKEALLSARAQEQESVLTENYIRALLRGEWQAESDILQEQDRVGVSLDAPAYAVLVVHFWRKIDKGEARRTMQESLHREFGESKAFLAGMSHENIACLLLADDTDLRESIEAVADDFARKLPVTTLASDTVASVLNVSQAYRQARVMSRMVQDDEVRLYWYRDLFQDDALYNDEYSMYSETALRNNIAAGNEQGTLEILNDLYDKNLQSSVYSDHLLRFFAYDLYRLVNHMSTANASAERKEALEQLRYHLDQVIESPKSFDGFFEEVKGFCLQLCSQNENRKTLAGEGMLDKISQYVDGHFTDPELSVTAIADAFGISGKYLSLFYKEQTNEKISSVIEKKRIDYACHLLETTDMTINEIALASGYALTHTFRVAFKKVQGVTPLEWKKSRSTMKWEK